jgi:Na+-driven multidrug efflux pump
LIFGNFGLPELGIEGAGWSLLIARILELTMLIVYVNATKDHPLAGKIKEIFSFDKALAFKVLRTSAPVIATEASFGLVTFLTFIAFGLVGSSTMAVMQVASIVNEFFMAIFIGLVNAAAVITGNELGRGEIDLAYKHGKLVVGLTIVLGLIVSVLLVLLRQPIVYIYGFYYEASAMFYGVLLVYALFFTPRMLDYALVCAVLRAGGDTRFCLIVNSAALWLISVPFAFISASIWQWPLYGVLAMVLLGDAVSGCICFFRFRSKKWLRKLI